MKATPILEELKIAAEASLTSAREVYPPTDTYDLMNEDVVPGINDAIKRHKRLCTVLREALAWSKQDATNEDCFPSQDMLDARVHVLTKAIKLAKQ